MSKKKFFIYLLFCNKSFQNDSVYEQFGLNSAGWFLLLVLVWVSFEADVIWSVVG